MPRLLLRYGDIYTRVARFLKKTYVPSGWAASNPAAANTDLAECQEIAKEGYLIFLGERDWAFLKPGASLGTWASVTGTTGATHTYKATVTGTSESAAPSYRWPHSTMTTTTATFTEDHVGDKLVVSGGSVNGTYYIDEYISTTSVKVAGDASGEGAAAKTFTITPRVPYTIVTATASKFLVSMEGQKFRFDTSYAASSTEYTIFKYVSATTIWLAGDASGEAASDTFTIPASGDYRLPDDFGGLTSGFSFDSSNPYPPPQERPPGFIRNRRSLNAGVTSWPQWYALQAAPGGLEYEQVWDVMFEPIPGTAYTFTYQYRLNPPEPKYYTDVLYGGPEHNMTIIQAALMRAEQVRGDTNGPQTRLYTELMLPRSVKLDTEKVGRQLGPMKGGSDTAGYPDHQHIVVLNPLTA